MLLVRAIFFGCLVYFSQELRLSKRAIEDGASSTHKIDEPEPKKAAVPASVPLKKEDHDHSESKNEHEHSKDHVHSDVHPELKNGEQNPSSSKNAAEHVISENPNGQASTRPKKEADQVHTTEPVVKSVKSSEQPPHRLKVDEKNAQSENDAKNDAASENLSERLDLPKSEADHVVSENAEHIAKKSKSKPEEPMDLPANGRRNNRLSKWCQNLQNCQPNRIEICGYDDKAGFAKFTDFCHMIEVNCYWGHDFTLHTCQAMQIKQMGRPRNVL